MEQQDRSDPAMRQTGAIRTPRRRVQWNAGRRIANLRSSMRPLLQASLAAAVAWAIATRVFGHPQPIFAPISAVVAVGATVGLNWQRAVEVVVGVAIGVGVADALAVLIGQGAVQVGVIVLAAMAVSVLLGGGAMFVVQAGTAASVVASVPTADGINSLDRVLDTLVGGSAALLFSLIVLPVRPLQLARRSAAPVLESLSATFVELARALREQDPAAAEQALERARATGTLWAQLDEAVGVGRQTARFAPVRRGDAVELIDVAQCVTQLDYAIRDARILARVSWRLIETGNLRGEQLARAAEQLADSVQGLDGHLAGRHDETLRTRAAALRACAIATLALRGTDDIVLAHVVGQVRSSTVDLLRATGLSRSDALERMLATVAQVQREPEDRPGR